MAEQATARKPGRPPTAKAKAQAKRMATARCRVCQAPAVEGAGAGGVEGAVAAVLGTRRAAAKRTPMRTRHEGKAAVTQVGGVGMWLTIKAFSFLLSSSWERTLSSSFRPVPLFLSSSFFNARRAPHYRARKGFGALARTTAEGGEQVKKRQPQSQGRRAKKGQPRRQHAPSRLTCRSVRVRL